MNQEQWARALLGRLGYKTSKANVTAVMAWMRAEGGHWNNTAHYNPLNTTQRMSGASSMNSVGVKAYTSWEQGLQATVITLKNGYYRSILGAFKNGSSASAVANAVVNSPWGTKHISVSGINVTGQTGGDLGSTYSVSAADPKLDKYELAQKYGLTYATIKANKELYSLFQKAVKGQWDATLFTAKLKNTHWWRTTSDSQRKFFLLRTGDPATYKAKWSSYQFSINKMAVDVGLTTQINSKGQSSALLKKAIDYKMRDGWSDARIKAYLGSHVGMHGNEMYGEAGEAYDQVFSLAYANGQTYSKGWYQDNIRKVVSGKTTIEALQAQIRNAAASKYYAFANQIRAGQTVLDLAQPYVSAVAQILELPQTDIDLKNKYVEKAMTSKVAAGQMGGTQYPLWKFENDLRSDPLWKKTNNARESMFSVAHQVAKDFGMAF